MKRRMQSPVGQAVKWVVAALVLAPTVALADENLDWLEAEGTVAEAADRLQAVVEAAGATVFARVDHAAGAEEAGMSLPESQLLVFGNPKLGTPVIMRNFRAGLVLPLRVLVVEDEGQTWFVTQDTVQMMDSVNVDGEVEGVAAIDEALIQLTEKAAKAE